MREQINECISLLRKYAYELGQDNCQETFKLMINIQKELHDCLNKLESEMLEDAEKLKAHIVMLEGWNERSTIEWAGNLYKDNIATRRLMLEVEGLRKGVGISYLSCDDDPLVYLKRVMPSIEQLNIVEKIRIDALDRMTSEICNEGD